MKVTVERSISTADIATFYALYAAAFDPIRTKATARHTLTAEEFTAEMTDERIDKYVAWHNDGRPIALSALATDLSAVPWISPDYFAARYPAKFSRGAVYYLMYTLVHPDHVYLGAFPQVMTMIERRCIDEEATAGFDICAYNGGRSVGRATLAVGRSEGATMETLDVQTYYAASFDPKPGTADAGHAPGAQPERSESRSSADVAATDEISASADVDIVTAAQRPFLAMAVADLLRARWPAFMLDGHPGHKVDLTELLMTHMAHQVLLVGADGALLGAGLSLPLYWDGTVNGLPAGWDDAITASAGVGASGVAANAVCALSITTAEGRKGHDDAARIVAGIKEAARDAGMKDVIIPVRPVLKTRYPLVPMADYLTWLTEDGQIFDPWVRLHVGLGATVLGLAADSMTISGTVAEWQTWLGMLLPGSAQYVIKGGIAPLTVDREADTGVYRESNPWVVHRGGS
ncbi:MAG: hypothetical protein QOE03_40, partial [Micromonosporaceae bacterium]|nr:hypothetical protein [Micromonosporaceae bacterium]